eukprot:Gregarina_sp_Poly_1__6193@NODE_3280_length_1215_cov_7_101045_g2083_i0_p1_GENE_NODE_3280_length_1215_cov_7_101045_g2083_i0NODE_3280_length_1215_cov_7_101045_g2083_i0_p1_ORF_typecomplete_len137_score17_53SFassemblin/PF06705_11/0_00061PBC/PF03792_13/0_022BLOC1_2/PF10046_9/1_5BLOC1_2/PF10046_9/92CENPF_leu_zip/PF10473_9/0_021CENPF_leu_zip/PF10473_9/1_7e03DUF4407/PF14362_6/0_077Exonuc_VII_L/PF02601_15/0_12TMF_TATA_bd/PF12325_8/0_077TMF_TATA_bd/PF12325_8/6e03CCDC73/PF15818_5/0_16Allexi_40kDa/PF05549_11
MSETHDGSRRLKSQLNSIRQSIIKFEKELNAGAEKKQKLNDQKFQGLQCKLEQINSLIDHEVDRVEDEMNETETNSQQALELIWQSLVRGFGKSIEGSARPFELYKHKCDVLWTRLEKLEQAKESNPLMVRPASQL